MKFALACSLFIGSESASTSDFWEAYKQEFNKDYSNANGDEDGYRRGVFEQNLIRIAALNVREPLADYGPTVLSDLTPEEFKAAYLSGYVPSNSTLLELPVETSLEVAAVQDWTGKYTTPIKNQGSCGSCWAFSATEQVESDAMREHGWSGTLSTQELVDCTEDGQGSKRGGCNGGNPSKAYKVLQAIGGSVSDNAYQYTGKDGTCNINSYKPLVGVASYKSVGRGSESTMKSYVGSTGPLSVCVDANDWSNYRGGVKTSCGTSTDHCVQIVGYGSDSGTDYWKVRNSWGSSHFGENGFLRLAIGKNLCNIANSPTATSTMVLGPSPSPTPSPTPSPSPTGCSDSPSNWLSSESEGCDIYVGYHYCTSTGGLGSGWKSTWGSIADYADSQGRSALDACCGCGGGSKGFVV